MKFKYLSILALAFLLILPACGGDDDSKKSSSPAKPKESAAPKADTKVDGEASYKIKDGSGNTLAKIKMVNDRRWTLNTGKEKFALEKQDNYQFKLPDGKKLKGNVYEDKVKLKDGDEELVQVKFYDDKVKVELKGMETWEFKHKGDKIKVFEGEIEMGSIRYYSDTGKLKAKAPGKDEVAVSKDIGRLTYAMCPFLMADNVPMKYRAFVSLVLFQMGK